MNVKQLMASLYRRLFRQKDAKPQDVTPPEVEPPKQCPQVLPPSIGVQKPIPPRPPDPKIAATESNIRN